MKLTKALNIIRHHQLWRLGDEITMLHPTQITEAINVILAHHQQTDSILESLIEKYKERAEIGQKKYNTTLDRTDLSLIDWVNHAQEEAMDLSLYLQKIKTMLND